MATWTKEALEYLADQNIPVDNLEAKLKEFMEKEIGSTQPLFLYYPDGKNIKMGPAPCVATFNMSRKEPIIATGSGHVDDFKKCPTYLEWLLNDSPWAECYLLKDLEDVYELGVVCRTDKPANFLMQALIVPRHFREYEKAIQTSNILMKDYGFDGHLATMVGVNYHVRDSAVYQKELAGHNALEASGCEKYWWNFLNHKGESPEPVYIDGNGYRCIDNYWKGKSEGKCKFVPNCMREAAARLTRKPKALVTQKEREINPWIEKIQEIKNLEATQSQHKYSLEILPMVKEVLTERLMKK